MKWTLCRAENESLELTVLWDGKPRADVSVSVTVADGDAKELKTDEKGQVTLKPVGEGLLAVVANFVDETAKGELNGKPYAAVASYANADHALEVPLLEDAEPAPEEKAGVGGEGRADARCANRRSVVAGAGVQFWRGGGRWLALCLQRPHGDGARSFGGQSVAAFSAACNSLEARNGRAADATAAARAWRSWLTREACIASAA